MFDVTCEAAGSTPGHTFVVHVHLLQQVNSDWLDGFQAQPVHVGRRVIPGQSGQVDTRDGLQQPGGLTRNSQRNSSVLTGNWTFEQLQTADMSRDLKWDEREGTRRQTLNYAATP